MALTRVQGTGIKGAYGLSVTTATFPTPPTVGNGLVIMLVMHGNTPSAPTCADNLGNPYLLGRWASNNGAVIFYCPKIAVSAASLTITATVPDQTNNWFQIGAVEVAGVGLGLGVDQVAGTATTTTSTPTTGSTPPLTASEVFVAAAVNMRSYIAVCTVETVSPPWVQEYDDTQLQNYAAGEADTRVLTGMTGLTTQCNWTLSDSQPGSSSLVAFKGDVLYTPPPAMLRVSQLPVEVAVLSSIPVSLRISQLPVEVAVLSSAAPEMRVTHHVVEVLNQQPADVRVTQHVVETLVSGAFEERITTGTRVAAANNAFAPTLFNGDILLPTVSKQVHVMDSDQPMPSTSGLSYTGFPVGTPTFLSTETQRQAVWAVAGTFRHLVLAAASPPGAGKSWTFTFRKNGVPTAITAMISGTELVGQDLTHSVTVAPGDLLTLEALPSGSPVTVTRLSLSIEFESTVLGESGYSSCRTVNQISTSAARYQGVFRMNNDWTTTSPTAGGARNIAAVSGAITGLYLWTGTAPGAGKSWTFTLWKNGVRQDGTTSGSVDTRLVISGASAISGSVAFSLPVFPGDILTLESLPTGTPAGGLMTASVRFLSTVPGQSPFCGGTNTSPASTQGYSVKVPSIIGTFDYVEAFINSTVGAVPTFYLLEAMRVHGDVAPGVGKSMAYDIWWDSAPRAALPRVVITGTDGGGVDQAGVLSVTAPGTFSLRSTPTGTPAVGAAVRWGFVQSIGIGVPKDIQVPFCASTSFLVGPKVAVVTGSGVWMGESGGQVWVD